MSLGYASDLAILGDRLITVEHDPPLLAFGCTSSDAPDRLRIYDLELQLVRSATISPCATRLAATSTAGFYVLHRGQAPTIALHAPDGALIRERPLLDPGAVLGLPWAYVPRGLSAGAPAHVEREAARSGASYGRTTTGHPMVPARERGGLGVGLADRSVGPALRAAQRDPGPWAPRPDRRRPPRWIPGTHALDRRGRARTAGVTTRSRCCTVSRGLGVARRCWDMCPLRGLRTDGGHAILPQRRGVVRRGGEGRGPG